MVCILEVLQFNADLARGKKEETKEFKQEWRTCTYKSKSGGRIARLDGGGR